MIAVSALVTSISSIAIALHHGHIMAMLVQANSFPYMQGGFSDRTPEDKEVLSLDLLNRGVGPAHQESLRVKVGDRYVTSVDELFAASLGPEQSVEARAVLHPIWNRVRTRFIPGGQSQMVFRLAKTPENAQLWDLLEKDQARCRLISSHLLFGRLAAFSISAATSFSLAVQPLPQAHAAALDQAWLPGCFLPGGSESAAL